MEDEPRGSSRRIGTVYAGGDVEAVVNYFSAVVGRPTFHAQDHGRDNIAFESRMVPITDGRHLAGPPSLEREGITLAPHLTAVTDFYDVEQVREIYLPEVARLIASLTGASQVFTLPEGGYIRFAERSDKFQTGVNTQPARFPHIDWTHRTAPGVAEQSFGGSAIPLRPGQRVVGFNIWRVISGPPQDVPLAVCDTRSVAPDDLVEADGVYDVGDPPWMTSEAYLLRYNPAHRWLYFSDMRVDEALVFRAYDSGASFRPGAAHTAFSNPRCPGDAPPRVSVEARAYAVVEDGAD